MPYSEVMKSEALITARLEARLPIEVMVPLKRASEIQGRTLTDFVVAAADEAACRAIEQTEIIRLSIEDQRQIADAILNPPALNMTVGRFTAGKKPWIAIFRPRPHKISAAASRIVLLPSRQRLALLPAITPSPPRAFLL